jgi:glycosyltransferase involved in cell wall biosynthesis
MKIAQIAPLFESVPPQCYGGTERVVSYLTEELVRQGHQVTLFASGDSKTAAELVPICPRSLRLHSVNGSEHDHVVHHLLQIERVFKDAGQFDIVHSHVDYFAYSVMRRHPEVANVSTLHGRLDLDFLVPLYQEFLETPLVSISHAQRAPLPWVNWRGTVYHGLPRNLHTYHPDAGKYLAFVGRISPEKRVDAAIEIATRAGMPLKIAAKVDPADREYFRTVVEPRLDNAWVEFVGEIGEVEKGDFLGNAAALLFPIDWPEPFGLVMIEAMACGTPVIARPRGSVPEIMVDGVTGYIVEDVDAAVAAVGQLSKLSRAGCRRVFDERFTAERMARDYVSIYRDLSCQREGGSHRVRRYAHAGDHPVE